MGIHEIIFTTARCKGILTDKVHKALYDFLKSKEERYGFKLKQVGVIQSKKAASIVIDVLSNFNLKEVVRKIKGGSSYALREQFPDLKEKLPRMWDRTYEEVTKENGLPGSVKAMDLVERRINRRSSGKRLSRRGRLVKQMLEEGMSGPKVRKELAKDGISVSLNMIYCIKRRFNINSRGSHVYMRGSLDKMQEAEYIIQLRRTGKKVTEIAQLLKVSRMTIHRRIKYFLDHLEEFPKLVAKWEKVVKEEIQKGNIPE